MYFMYMKACMKFHCLLLMFFRMKKQLLLCSSMLAWLLLTFTAMRLIFYAYYYNEFSGVSFKEIFFSFLVGLRFDVASVMIVGGIFFLLLLLPFSLTKKKRFQRIILIAFSFFMLPWFILSAGDLLYYQFVGRRLSIEIFSISKNFPEVTRMIAKEYSHSLVLFVLILFALYLMLWKIVQRITNDKLPIKNEESRFKILVKETLIFISALVIIFISIRGGFQLKPLRESYAFRNDVLQLGHLSLNPVFTVVRALWKGDSETTEFFPKEFANNAVRELLKNNEEFLDEHYPLMRKRNLQSDIRNRKSLNVVIIIMESWGAKNIGAFGSMLNATSNFDSLARNGMLFTNFFASGQRTIQGMQAIVGSLPTLLREDIIGSSLEQNSFCGLGTILKSNGYQTLFIHGARAGSMGFDAFATVTGFEKIISKEDFDLNVAQEDGTWGMFDEYIFAKANEEFRSLQEPFCGVVFSLTSHSPYKVPSQEFEYYNDSIPHYQYFNTLRYSDIALGHFFTNASKEKYFENTIFVIVADHVEGYEEKNMFEQFHIPCLFFSPNHIRPQIVNNVFSQVDILPTIIKLLNISTPFSSFGIGADAYLNNPERNFAFVADGTFFGWITDSLFLVSNEEYAIGLYEYRQDTQMRINILSKRTSVAEHLLRAMYSYVQVGRTVLKENKVFTQQYRASRK